MSSKFSPSAILSSSADSWIGQLLESDEPDENLDRLVTEAASLFKVPIAMINLLTSDTVVFKACVGQTPGDCLDRDGSFCDVAVSQQPALMIVDARLDPQFSSYALVTNEMQIRSYFGKSLHAPDGTRIGTLCLLDTEPRQYSELQEQALNELAQQAESTIKLLLGGSLMQGVFVPGLSAS